MSGAVFVYILVAAAAGMIGYVVWQTIVATGEISSARFDRASSLDADGRQKKPLDRFIEPGTLFRMRVVSAALPALVVPCLFLSAGFANPLFLLAFAAVFAFVGWMVPLKRFEFLVRKRQLLFEERILDLTMGVANALRSGMALPQAIDRLTEQMKGPMREELDILRAEYRLGVDIAESFERLTERMPCEDMRLLTASIRLTMQTGGSLADVLTEMTATIRARREFQDKLKTLTAQGRFEGLGLGLMPVIAFVIFYFIQPELMALLYTTQVGWMMLGLVAVLETLGFVTINKICKVEV